MSQGKYTNFGVEIWSWKPWTSLPSLQAKLVWIALYTTTESKRLPPGLFHGSVHTLAEASSLQPDEVLKGLDDLLEADLVEFDRERRLIRLTQLPDANERPKNGRHLRGMWNQFRSLPDCALRNAHVRLLWWLMEQGAMTEDHTTAWRETFGTVVVPPVRKRGVRTLGTAVDADAVQQSLFRTPVRTPEIDLDTVSNDPSGASSNPVSIGLSNQAGSTPEVNDLNNSGYRIVYGIGYRQEKEKEKVLDLSFSGSTPTLAAVESTSPTPHLTLVPGPPPAACTARQMVAWLSGSESTVVTQQVEEAIQQAICRTFDPTVGVSPGEAIRAFRSEMSGVPTASLLHWVTEPGHMAEAVTRGHQALERKRAHSADLSHALALARKEAGV